MDGRLNSLIENKRPEFLAQQNYPRLDKNSINQKFIARSGQIFSELFLSLMMFIFMLL
jgi:hypothetical protein